MSGHTPEPWWVLGDGITVCPPKPRGQWIIRRASEVYMDRAQRAANARLIAAAPDLMEALGVARSFVTDELAVRIDSHTLGGDLATLDDEDAGMVREALDCLARIDAAVARATGAKP